MGVGEQRMRIIAGTHRGRRIAAPPGQRTRPTTDRVRESLFSSLVSLSGPDLGGGPALDAFAGSGALGLEALSRGATPVVFSEKDRRTAAVLRANVQALGVEAVTHVLPSDAFSLAERYQGPAFSLILLDPPYTLDAALVARLLTSLLDVGKIRDGALVTWEHAAGSPVTWPERFAPVTGKRYGTMAVDIARYEGGGEAA